MTQILAFIRALPALIELFKILQKRIDEAQVNRKVTEDIRTIHEAFHAKDPALLNALFKSHLRS